MSASLVPFGPDGCGQGGERRHLGRNGEKSYLLANPNTLTDLSGAVNAGLVEFAKKVDKPLVQVISSAVVHTVNTTVKISETAITELMVQDPKYVAMLNQPVARALDSFDYYYSYPMRWARPYILQLNGQSALKEGQTWAGEWAVTVVKECRDRAKKILTKQATAQLTAQLSAENLRIAAAETFKKEATEQGKKIIAQKATNELIKYGFKATLGGVAQRVASGVGLGAGIDYGLSVVSTAYRCTTGQNTTFNKQSGIVACSQTFVSEVYQDFPQVKTLVKKHTISSASGMIGGTVGTLFAPGVGTCLGTLGGSTLGSILTPYFPDLPDIPYFASQATPQTISQYTVPAWNAGLNP